MRSNTSFRSLDALRICTFGCHMALSLPLTVGVHCRGANSRSTVTKAQKRSSRMQPLEPGPCRHTGSPISSDSGTWTGSSGPPLDDLELIVVATCALRSFGNFALLTGGRALTMQCRHRETPSKCWIPSVSTRDFMQPDRSSVELHTLPT